MARSQRPAKFIKPRASSRKAANALGYAKRQSAKSKTLTGSISDVYDYQPEKVRRAKVALQLEKDELLGAGGESEDDQGRDATRPSDEAFEESDDERFAGFDFSHRSKSKSSTKANSQKKQTSARSSGVRFAEVDLNEDEDAQASAHSKDSDSDEEEEEEGDPDEFIDVLDIMDGKGEADDGEELGKVEVERKQSRRVQKNTKAVAQQLHRDKDEEEEDEDDIHSAEEASSDVSEEYTDHHISASDAEDDREDASALQNLEQFVTSLDAGQKRKAPDDDDADAPAPVRKRRILKERTEAGAENEFAAHVGGGRLRLDDLLAPLATQTSNLLSLKKSAKVLTSQSGANKTLAAPLPQRTAERLDREAAYEQTKEEVDKWKATMQRIREAEHLSFPLQAKPAGKTSNLELAAKFKPTTELESAVDKLLKSAKMREEDIAQTESLKMNHLSIEEVAARRAELAKMRALMFRAEAKAKRVAKIKSKTYRRIKKKERARLAEKLGEGEDQDEDDEEVRLKRETERARERATLRHKNTGKWAKAMRSRGELDEDQRRDIGEMLDRGERLRRRIRGEGSGDEEDSEDESDAEDGEESIRRIRENAFEELAALDGNDDSTMAEGGKKGKSLFEMKFMKEGMARDAKRADEMVDDFVKEMGARTTDEDAEADVEEQPYGTAVNRVGGRATFRPGPGSMPIPLRSLGSLASDTSSVTLRSTDLLEPSRESPPVEHPAPENVDPPQAEETNPWLAPRTGDSVTVRRRHEIAVSKNSTSIEKTKNKLSKRAKKREEEKAKAKDDATVDISLSNVITLANGIGDAGSLKQVATPSSTYKTLSATRQASENDDSDANSEVDAQETLLSRKGKGKASGMKAFEQRDLVALAFAGDKVVQEFAEQKRREMQEDAPREVDTTLPGWGSWGGIGAKKAPPKPYLVKKIAGVDPSSRADYKKAHVIISEKRDKKAAKYLVKDLPYPYTSKAQFERSIETPIGTEWNTRVGFQRATLPKVVKKMGTVITPLEKLL
ncbi:Utp14-domain-containing protein [Amylocystis lapponica]|nr:Utp14-domain-containing protein [Amylocystis lapponica]